MWQEARKQEKAIRGMMIDFQKRAERRKAYYQRMQQDPVQMIRVIGSTCTVHIDPAIASSAENPKNMIPWQGDQEILIDKYDARQWLDYFPESLTSQESDECVADPEEQKCNYERYRTLVQSNFLQISEEQRLEQIRMDEVFGKSQQAVASKTEKQKLAGKKAAIGYSYSDTAQPVVVQTKSKQTQEASSESDEDFDLVVKMDSLTKSQIDELNSYAQQYGIPRHEFYRMLKHDRADYDAEEAMKEFDEIRKNLTGRKAKKQRRMERDKRRKRRQPGSPVSYAKRSSPSYEPYQFSSRSTSPEETGKVEFITEFGGEVTETVSVNANPPIRETKRYRRRRSSSSSSSESSLSDRSRSQPRRSHRSHSRERSHDHRDKSHTSSRSRTSHRDRHSYSRHNRWQRSRSVSRDRNSRRRSGDSRHSKRSRSRSRSRTPSPQVEKKGVKRMSESCAKTDTAKVAKPAVTKKLTPQEKLKKRMQIMLNKQFKSDKVKEREKEEQREQERKEREDDLRELTRLYREKARRDEDNDWFEYRHRSKSLSRSPSPKGSSRHRNRSRSPRSRYR